MKLIAFFITAYLAVVLTFAGLLSVVIVLIIGLCFIVFDSVKDFLTDEVRYFDSEDIGREVMPYVKRRQFNEWPIVALCLALLIMCLIAVL